MRERFTRRRFLSAVGAGATYLALTNVVGCDLSERVPQAKTPKGGGPSIPKVSPLPNASLAPQKDGRAFRSRPDLSPPAVEVTTQAHDTPRRHLCRPGEWRRWAGRLDDRRRSRRGLWSWCFNNTKNNCPELRFLILLTEDGTQHIELVRA
jgi:hypothetical protein